MLTLQVLDGGTDLLRQKMLQMPGHLPRRLWVPNVEQEFHLQQNRQPLDLPCRFLPDTKNDSVSTHWGG